MFPIGLLGDNFNAVPKRVLHILPIFRRFVKVFLEIFQNS